MRRFYSKSTSIYFYTGSSLRAGMSVEEITKEIKKNRGNLKVDKALSANQMSPTQISLLSQHGVFNTLPEEDLIYTESSDLSMGAIGTVLSRLFEKYDIELSVNSQPEVYLVGYIKIDYVTKPIPVNIILIKSKIKNELLSGDEKAVEQVNRIFMRTNSRIKQGDLKTLALESSSSIELEGTIPNDKSAESLDEFYGVDDANIMRETFKRLNLPVPTSVYAPFKAGKYSSESTYNLGRLD